MLPSTVFFLFCAIGTGILGAMLFVFAQKARENESGAAQALTIAGGICLLFTVGFLACVVIFVLAFFNGWWTVSKI